MVWDTGLTDTLFTTPPTDPNAWKRKNSLAGELEKLGVKSSEVKFVAVSHTHSDHIGNVERSLEVDPTAEPDAPARLRATLAPVALPRARR